MLEGVSPPLNVMDAQHEWILIKTITENPFKRNVHDLAKIVNGAKQTDSVLLDFSKAYDKVSHTELCFRLLQYGIRGKLKWIKNFLSN